MTTIWLAGGQPPRLCPSFSGNGRPCRHPLYVIRTGWLSARYACGNQSCGRYSDQIKEGRS